MVFLGCMLILSAAAQPMNRCGEGGDRGNRRVSRDALVGSEGKTAAEGAAANGAVGAGGRRRNARGDAGKRGAQAALARLPARPSHDISTIDVVHRARSPAETRGGGGDGARSRIAMKPAEGAVSRDDWEKGTAQSRSIARTNAPA